MFVFADGIGTFKLGREADLSVEIESQTAMGENHRSNKNAVTSALCSCDRSVDFPGRGISTGIDSGSTSMR